MFSNYIQFITYLKMILLFKLFAISLLFYSCKLESKEIGNPITYSKQLKQAPTDTLLINIESKIYNAFTLRMVSKESENLTKIIHDLNLLYQKEQQNLILYWQGYTYYYLAIAHLQEKNKKEAERTIEQGIDLLEDMKNKNSEDYALLALLEGFAIQFKGFMAMFAARSIKNHANQAIEMETTNLRGYYVLGNNDYYTPEKYGGGKEVENYLLKALSLPSQKVPNPYLPSWGKKEAYELLIKYYIRKENWKAAKRYFQEAIARFPKSYQIQQLAAKMLNK